MLHARRPSKDPACSQTSCYQKRNDIIIRVAMQVSAGRMKVIMQRISRKSSNEVNRFQATGGYVSCCHRRASFSLRENASRHW